MADPKNPKIEQIENISGDIKKASETEDAYLDRILAKYKASNAEIAKKVKETKKQLELEKEILKIQKEREGLDKREADINKKKSSSNQENLKESQKLLKNLKEQYEEAKRSGDLNEEKTKKLKKQLDEQEKIHKKLKQEVEELKKSNKEAKELDEEFKEVDKSAGGVVGTLSKIGSGISGLVGGVVSLGTSLISGIYNGIKGLASGIHGAFDVISGGMLGNITGTFGNITGFIKDGIRELMDRQKEFASTTGVAAKSVGVDLARMGKYYGNLGVDVDSVNKTYLRLFESMSKFSRLSTKEQERLSVHTTLMGNFGISQDAVARNYEILTRSMGKSTAQLTQFSDRLMRHAIGAGIAPKKMVEEFAQAAPRLLAYGQRAEEVYIKLAKAAKGLGVEMSTLTGVLGDQFDSFEGSAKIAGQLNAVLGGNYLNSIELLNASEEQRLVILRRSLDMAGVSFGALDKWGKKTIATIMQTSDMDQLTRMFGGSTADLTKQMNSQAATQDKLMAGLKEAADPLKKISAFFDTFKQELMPFAEKTNEMLSTIASPEVAKKIEGVIEQIKSFLMNLYETAKGYITNFMNDNNITFDSLQESFMKKVGSMQEGLMGAFETAKVFLMDTFNEIKAFFEGDESITDLIKRKFLDLAGFVSENLSKFAPSFKTVAIAVGAIALAVWGWGKASKTAAPEVAGLTFEIVAIGAAIGIAGWGISKVGEGIKFVLDGLGGLIKDIFGSIVELIKAPAAAVKDFGQGVKDLSAAASDIGLVNLGKLVVIIKDMAGVGDAFAATQITYSKLTYSINNLNVGNIDRLEKHMTTIRDFASVDKYSDNLAALGSSMEKMSQSFNTLPADKLLSFNQSLVNFDKLISNSNLVASSKAIVEAVTMISSALNSMPENKKVMLESVVSTINTVKQISDDQLKPSKQFFEVVTKYYEAQANSKTADQDAVVQALKEATRAIVGELKESRDSQPTINVKVDSTGNVIRMNTPAKDVLYTPG